MHSVMNTLSNYIKQIDYINWFNNNSKNMLDKTDTSCNRKLIRGASAACPLKGNSSSCSRQKSFSRGQSQISSNFNQTETPAATSIVAVRSSNTFGISRGGSGSYGGGCGSGDGSYFNNNNTTHNSLGNFHVNKIGDLNNYVDTEETSNGAGFEDLGTTYFMNNNNNNTSNHFNTTSNYNTSTNYNQTSTSGGGGSGGYNYVVASDTSGTGGLSSDTELESILKQNEETWIVYMSGKFNVEYQNMDERGNKKIILKEKSESTDSTSSISNYCIRKYHVQKHKPRHNSSHNQTTLTTTGANTSTGGCGSGGYYDSSSNYIEVRINTTQYLNDENDDIITGPGSELIKKLICSSEIFTPTNSNLFRGDIPTSQSAEGVVPPGNYGSGGVDPLLEQQHQDLNQYQQPNYNAYQQQQQPAQSYYDSSNLNYYNQQQQQQSNFQYPGQPNYSNQYQNNQYNQNYYQPTSYDHQQQQQQPNYYNQQQTMNPYWYNQQQATSYPAQTYGSYQTPYPNYGVQPQTSQQPSYGTPYQQQPMSQPQQQPFIGDIDNYAQSKHFHYMKNNNNNVEEESSVPVIYEHCDDEDNEEYSHGQHRRSSKNSRGNKRRSSRRLSGSVRRALQTFNDNFETNEAAAKSVGDGCGDSADDGCEIYRCDDTSCIHSSRGQMITSYHGSRLSGSCGKSAGMSTSNHNIEQYEQTGEIEVCESTSGEELEELELEPKENKRNHFARSLEENCTKIEARGVRESFIKSGCQSSSGNIMVGLLDAQEALSIGPGSLAGGSLFEGVLPSNFDTASQKQILSSAKQSQDEEDDSDSRNDQKSQIIYQEKITLKQLEEAFTMEANKYINNKVPIAKLYKVFDILNINLPMDDFNKATYLLGFGSNVSLSKLIDLMTMLNKLEKSTNTTVILRQKSIDDTVEQIRTKA